MRRRNKGFTLIEMLIVVVIIGVLAAIILPKMTSSSHQAKINACQGNIKSINTTLELMAFEIQGYAASTVDGDFPGLGVIAAGIGSCAQTDLETYFPDGGIECPAGDTSVNVIYAIVDNRVDLDDASSPHRLGSANH